VRAGDGCGVLHEHLLLGTRIRDGRHESLLEIILGSAWSVPSSPSSMLLSILFLLYWGGLKGGRVGVD
jgi:hypothetical protein